MRHPLTVTSTATFDRVPRIDSKSLGPLRVEWALRALGRNRGYQRLAESADTSGSVARAPRQGTSAVDAGWRHSESLRRRPVRRALATAAPSVQWARTA